MQLTLANIQTTGLIAKAAKPSHHEGIEMKLFNATGDLVGFLLLHSHEVRRIQTLTKRSIN